MNVNCENRRWMPCLGQRGGKGVQGLEIGLKAKPLSAPGSRPKVAFGDLKLSTIRHC
jgi:hypothetical protein